MYDWSAEEYDTGMDIDIEILFDDTVGTDGGGVLRPPALGPGACGWILMLI